ncbi:dipeptide epimerase [Sphingomonas sp.]|uniref:dipeptide epimerase n=1 Tax=Sphingomonas sp. TaxID=28214 RepID=UPI002BBC7A29|nr:dipeptide epimerase [Sphingomonas sp.]HWK36811.1 dipeptide epimerase [Sphingomonas sp.]
MKLSVHKKHIGLKQPFRVAFGTIAGLDVVEVELREGDVVGRGECCPMDIYGQSADATVAEIEAVAPLFDRGGIDRAALQGLLPSRSARNALDCALWDLEAKASGRSVWDLAGLAAPDAIASDITIGILSPEETASVAATLREATTIKLKLGGEHDLECLRAVRGVLPDTPLFVDVNAGWTLDHLNRMAPELAAADVFMIEQPLAPGEDALLDGYHRAVPLCADESCHDRGDLDRLVGRYDYVNIKLDKTGGLTEALALAAAARERGFRLMTGCMLGSGLAMAPAYVVASVCDVVDLDVPLIVRDAAHAGVRHDGRQVHRFAADLWG